ncbi:reverse transcriptase family protein [Harryflintia acetispora]|uniref:reverse transcriptase family protein n=1 Tax=Harryflintia acetispora TaxID=1849041 RepID=UPI0018979A1B|nr:reverse transcriptase family protein [Harryflintia acetispora]
MIYTDSSLYGLQSKAQLKRLLKIPSKEFFKQSFICSKIHPYIDTSQPEKKRLIESPEEDLKLIQKRIQKYLGQMNHPDYLLSGVKGKSYVDNAKIHRGNKHFFKTDFSAFFPNTSREKVYSFFRNELIMAPDIAEIMTNLTTINLDLTDSKDSKAINDFLLSKKIKLRQHLLSGAPTSQLLSFYCNRKMFWEMYMLAQCNNIEMSIYVDDIIFSSSKPFPKDFRYNIKRITKHYFLKLSSSKVKAYNKDYPKRVTGVIINKKGLLKIPNSLRQKIIEEFNNLQKNPESNESKQRLHGLVASARQIESNAYSSILEFVRSKSK